MESFIRTEMMFNKENMQKLKNTKVIVFGIGGVGGYVVEALARSGINNISIVDNDIVAKSNLNRQIIALNSTIGKKKVEVMKDRILDINPNCTVTAFDEFIDENTIQNFDLSNYDYVVDAIDFVKGKMAIIKSANNTKTPIISCMGTGNKVDPSAFKICDIGKTKICPLAKTIRKQCKQMGIDKLKVLYSNEKPIKTEGSTPSSNSFTPSVAGLLIAGEVIKDITNFKGEGLDLS